MKYNLFIFPAEEPQISDHRDLMMGELIGYRIWLAPHWRCKCPELCSFVFSEYKWEPNKIFVADPSQMITYVGNSGQIEHFETVCLGIHAWKTKEQAERYAKKYYASTIVVGTIWMWGDIVEHKHGYRSSHAKIRSLDSFYGIPSDIISIIKEKYKV